MVIRSQDKKVLVLSENIVDVYIVQTEKEDEKTKEKNIEFKIIVTEKIQGRTGQVEKIVLATYEDEEIANTVVNEIYMLFDKRYTLP